MSTMNRGERKRPKRRSSSSGLPRSQRTSSSAVDAEDIGGPGEERKRKVASSEKTQIKESGTSSSASFSTTVRGEKSRFSRFKEVFRKGKKTTSSKVEKAASILVSAPCEAEVPLLRSRTRKDSPAEAGADTETKNDADFLGVVKSTGAAASARSSRSRRGDDTPTPPLPVDLALSPRLLAQIPPAPPCSSPRSSSMEALASSSTQLGPVDPPASSPLPPSSSSDSCLSCPPPCPRPTFHLPPVVD